MTLCICDRCGIEMKDSYELEVTLYKTDDRGRLIKFHKDFEICNKCYQEAYNLMDETVELFMRPDKLEEEK